MSKYRHKKAPILVKEYEAELFERLMVPVAGLEPAHIAATDFESVVSTNSTTLALIFNQQTLKQDNSLFGCAVL